VLVRSEKVWLPGAAGALLILGLGAAPAPSPGGPPAPDGAGRPGVSLLEPSPGLLRERDIEHGAVQEYALPLAAGTYLNLELLPTGIDLDASLLDPAGTAVTAAEGQQGTGNTKLLALIAGVTGRYRLRVTTRGDLPLAGHYELRVRDARPAGPGDEIRVEARRAIAESRRLRSRRDLEAALVKAKAAQASLQSVADGPGEVEALAEIGTLYAEEGKPQEALDHHQRALKRAQESHFAEGEAWALGNIGYCYFKLADYERSISYYRSSVARWQELGRLPEQAFELQSLGKVYRQKGDLEEAMKSFVAAMKIQVATRDPAEQAHTLSGIGAVQYNQGKIDEALESFEQALELSRSVGDGESEATIELGLGGIYYRRGQLQKTVELFTELIGRIDLKEAGYPLYNLGGVYLDLGDLDKALENYQRSLSAYQRAGDVREQADALVGIGTTLQRMGNPEAALEKLRQAQKLLPKETWTLSHFMGLAQLAAERPAEALRSLERALAIAQAARDRSLESSTLLGMGAAYRALGQAQRAEEAFGRAIDLGTEIEYPSVVLPARLARARLRRDAGRLEGARADIEEALKIIESTRRNIAGQQIQTGYFASRGAYYEFYIDLLMQLERMHPESGYRSLALEASERMRARGLLDLLAEGRIDLSDGLSRDVRDKEHQIEDELSRLQEQLVAERGDAGRRQALRAQLQSLHDRQERLDWEIRRSNPRYAEVRYPVPLKADEIRQQLPDASTALLEYALGQQGSTLFVVTREKISSYPLPPAGEISRQVRVLRRTLEKESLLSWPEYLDAAFRLYQMLLAPAKADLAGKASLLIAPDRDLYYVPFEALLTGRPRSRNAWELPYLVKDYSVSYIPSANVLAGLRKPRPATAAGGMLLVAFAPFAGPEKISADHGPGAGRSEAKGLDPAFPLLPASRREVVGITSLYAGSSLELLDAQATEESVKHNPAVAAARRLHFATHAQLDERYPEYSSLLFSRAPGGAEDGHLRVQEIFNLKLSADLAVLSACQTGLGKEVTGEGLIGLSRAFFYAGVPSLVVSLWNVVDAPTPELMLTFYKDLDARGNKSRALQGAKLALISQRTYAHPSYWAPFILIGEPR
jgi:CHAT domain-containing protein/Tfp pilus assembly protein PilF